MLILGSQASQMLLKIPVSIYLPVYTASWLWKIWPYASFWDLSTLKVLPLSSTYQIQTCLLILLLQASQKSWYHCHLWSHLAWTELLSFPIAWQQNSSSRTRTAKLIHVNGHFEERDKNTLQFNSTLTWTWGFDYTEMPSDAKQFVSVLSPQRPALYERDYSKRLGVWIIYLKDIISNLLCSQSTACSYPPQYFLRIVYWFHFRIFLFVVVCRKRICHAY